MEFGYLEKSEQFLKESYKIIKKERGDKDKELIKIFSSLIDLYFEQGKFEESKDAFKKAFKVAAEHIDENNTEYQILKEKLKLFERRKTIGGAVKVEILKQLSSLSMGAIVILSLIKFKIESG